MLNRPLKELLEQYRNDPDMGDAVLRCEHELDLAQREYMKQLADIQRDFYRVVEDHIEEMAKANNE